MRVRLVLLAVAPLIYFCEVAQAHAPQITLAISANSPTVTVGSDVYIKIEMKNISDHNADCTKMDTMSGADLRYHYDVKDEAGLSIRPWKHPEIGESGSFHPCTLPPGNSSIGNDSGISSLFDLSPGKYIIRVWRFDDYGTVVWSNSIEVTVTR
jgi:hypothetical protein